MSMATPFQASRSALASIDAKSLRQTVARHIARLGDHGATCEEIENDLGLKHQTASARITELQKDKAIIPNGQRSTQSGRKATVWIVPIRDQETLF